MNLPVLAGKEETYTVQVIDPFGVTRDTDLVVVMDHDHGVAVDTTCTNHCAVAAGERVVIRNQMGATANDQRSRRWGISCDGSGAIVANTNQTWFNGARAYGPYNHQTNDVSNPGVRTMLAVPAVFGNLVVRVEEAITTGLTGKTVSIQAGPVGAVATSGVACAMPTPVAAGASCSDAFNTVAVGTGEVVSLGLSGSTNSHANAYAHWAYAARPPVETDTPEPTSTPENPEATSTPTPTFSQTPSPTATRTPTRTATATRTATETGTPTPTQLPLSCEIPTAGLQLWLKADALTGLGDGAAVATWPDSSGFGRDASQATAGFRPVYRAAQLNGRPAVQFNGTLASLSGTVPAAAGIDGNASKVVIAVARPLALGWSGQDAFVFAYGSAGDGFGLGVTPGGHLKAAQRGTSTYDLSGAGPALDTTGVYTAVKDGDELAVYVDGQGVAGPTSKGSVNNTDATYRLGTHPAGGRYFTGYLGELLVYAGTLSAAERYEIESCLRQKWANEVLPTLTPTPSATATGTVTATPTVTNTPTVTDTPTVTATPAAPPTETDTPTPTPTPAGACSTFSFDPGGGSATFAQTANGGTVPWSDDFWSFGAAIADNSDGATYLLRVTGGDLVGGDPVPSGATIAGVALELSATFDPTGDYCVNQALVWDEPPADVVVRLVDVNGSVVGDNKALFAMLSAPTTYGGSTDTWNAGLSGADFQGGGFGFAFQASFDDNTNTADDCGSASAPTIGVQTATMTVCWTP